LNIVPPKPAAIILIRNKTRSNQQIDFTTTMPKKTLHTHQPSALSQSHAFVDLSLVVRILFLFQNNIVMSAYGSISQSGGQNKLFSWSPCGT
jgi:hypothetical protein